MNDTEQTTALTWYNEHRAAYSEVIARYAVHPDKAKDAHAHTEQLAWLRLILSAEGTPSDEVSAKGLLTEVYHALWHIALSIREHARAAYREDALYQKVNALRPPMVRARVTMNF